MKVHDIQCSWISLEKQLNALGYIYLGRCSEKVGHVLLSPIGYLIQITVGNKSGTDEDRVQSIEYVNKVEVK